MCFSPQVHAIFRHQNIKKCFGADVFCTFHFIMCVSVEQRAFFRHLNSKKCSQTTSFLTFSLPNVLLAKAACIFSTSELQKVLRGPQLFSIFSFATAACTFWGLLSAPTSAPAALTGLHFDWPDTRIIEKTQHFATSLTFSADVSSFFWLSRYCIFFLLTWLLYSAFQLSEVCYLNFLRT